MIDLTISEYDRAERRGMIDLPICVRCAFRPATFAMVGFPSRAEFEREIFWFMEAIDQNEFSVGYPFTEGFSEEEFGLFKRICECALQFSKQRFGKVATSKYSSITAISALRHIRFLFGNERPRILEIGPGAGVLGALCYLEGYPYTAMDVTQGFYLLQNHLWNFLSGNSVVELALDETNTPIPEAKAGQIVHLPWWRYAELRPDTDLGFDIVIANTCLAEMHDWAMRFTVAMAAHFLRGKGKKYFLFDSTGAGLVGNSQYVLEGIRNLGFSELHRDEWIAVNSPVSSGLSREDGHVLRAITEGRRRLTEGGRVTLARVEEYLASRLGPANLLNEDQKFARLIGGLHNQFPYVFERAMGRAV